MPVDFAKYGGKNADTVKSSPSSVKIGVDFTKYDGSKPAANINPVGGVGNTSYGPTPIHTIAPYVPPKPSPWQSLTDNPIVHGAIQGAKATLDDIQKPFQAVSTTVADTAGALSNLFGNHTEMGYDGKPFTASPSQSRNLVKDVSSILTNRNSDIPAQAWQGADPNPTKFPGTNLDTNKLFDTAFQSIGPGELLKPFSALKDALVGSKVGDALDTFDKATPLALPPAKSPAEIAQMPFQQRMQYTDDLQANPVKQPIQSTEPLALPQGNFTPPTRLKVAGNNQTLDYVISKIKPEVMAQIEAPARRDLLVNYLQKNLNVPVEEIHNMKMTDLQELGQHVQAKLKTQLPEIANQVAAKYGHDLPGLMNGKAPSIAEQAAKDAQSRVYGVPAPDVNIKRPESFNVTHENPAAAPREQYQSVPTDQAMADARKARGQAPFKLSDTKPVTVTKLSDMRKSSDQVAATVERPKPSPQPILNRTELKHADTIKTSENSTPELRQALEDKTMTGKTTSDVINRTKAAEYIAQHGQEGAANKIIAKQGKLQPHEVTAAQILAKQFASKGGEANLNKALDIISKTATEGRQMGQAIQALSQWNKLDSEGALLQATRSAGRTLTPAEGKPIVAAAEHVQQVAATKSLSDEVLHIVTNKAPGEELTATEKAKIQEFHSQVKKVNESLKPFLPKEKIVKENKTDATIKEVSKIEPKARTRDQVVSFLDAKADMARARLAASRNKISSTPFDTYADMAIIGASHIAKGVVKLSDFTEQMVRDFGTGIKPQVNDIFTKATNIFRKENGLPTVQELDRVVNKAVKDERFTPEDAANFKAWAAEIGHYADHNLKVEAVQDLQAAMKDLGDSTLGQKIATVQTGSMLLNPVTIERNVLGNAVDYIGDKVSKVATVPIDWSLSKLTGSERTIVFSSMNQEKFWKNYMIGTKSGYRGVSPNGQLDSYGVHPNIFGKNNPLKYITKLLGASLQGFDHAFYSLAKGEVLATYAEQLGKAQGLTNAEIKSGMKHLIVQLDDRIHELADHAGRYATYQDETLLSKGAEMLRKGLNEASTGFVSKALVEKGMPKKLSMEGFGAGDVLVKFAKTPANLVMRGLDYSPVGFIRSIMDLGTFALKREKFNQHQAVRSLGRAITGTLGFTGMGYILADAGILTGSSSMDKDVRSIQEQSGQGAYKVNWSALGRFLRSGFNYDAAAYQKGDHLMDYQWLQPAAISVAMGVNANKAVKAHEAGDQTAGWQMAGKALLGGLQTVLENPMVQGLSSVIDAGTDIIKKQDPTKLINIAKGVPASFVPTLSNQARQSTDNYQRETFDKSLITEIGNMMANKIPGLSEKLPISYDSLGNAREKLQGGQANTVQQYLTSFFSPAKMTEYQVSPEAKMALDLMDQSGDASLLPRIVNKYFHVSQGKQLKDLKVNLTKEQFSQLQQETGKVVTDKLSQQATYLANPNVSLQKKVDKVKGILTDVGKKARQDIGQQMGFQKSKVKS